MPSMSLSIPAFHGDVYRAKGRKRTFFPGFPSIAPTIFSATPCTLSTRLGSLLLTVFAFGAAAFLGAIAFLATRPVAVLSLAAAPGFLPARGFEVLALVAAGFFAVVVFLALGLVAVWRDAGALVGTYAALGAVMLLAPRVTAMVDGDRRKAMLRGSQKDGYKEKAERWEEGIAAGRKGMRSKARVVLMNNCSMRRRLIYLLWRG